MNDHLRSLENQAILILREGFSQLRKPVVLWSMGKDSTVMLWLIRKAFLGKIPFPVLHIDTTKKIPEMISMRDSLARLWQIPLLVEKNEAALAEGMGPHLGRLNCCGSLKTEALKQAITKYGFETLFVAIRKDEEGVRAKERIFSQRTKNQVWDYLNQLPEVWDFFQTEVPEGTQMRVHPLLNWTEQNIWEYIQAEDLPFHALYLAKNGRRYRSLGCAPCTSNIDSSANTLPLIISELENSVLSERDGRAQDKESLYAMQILRKDGYM